MEAKKAVFIVAAALILFMGLFGIGGAAYHMGMREGMVQGVYYAAPAPPPVAEVRPAAPTGQPAPAVEPADGYRLHRGYAMRYDGGYRHGWGPFGLIGALIGGIFRLFFTLLSLAILFKVVRRIFFGRMGWGWHGRPGGPGWHGGPGGPGKWQEKWQAGPPPWVQEWHRKMHETPAATTETANPTNPAPNEPSPTEAKPTEETPSVTKL